MKNLKMMKANIKTLLKKDRKQKILNSQLISINDWNAKKTSLIHKIKYLNFQTFSKILKNKLVLNVYFLLILETNLVLNNQQFLKHWRQVTALLMCINAWQMNASAITLLKTLIFIYGNLVPKLSPLLCLWHADHQYFHSLVRMN